MFFYLKIGIWRGPTTNKLYPTLVWYGVSIESAIYHTNTSDVSIRYPCCQKSPNFIFKDQRNTFTNNMSAIQRTAPQS